MGLKNQWQWRQKTTYFKQPCRGRTCPITNERMFNCTKKLLTCILDNTVNRWVFMITVKQHSGSCPRTRTLRARSGPRAFTSIWSDHMSYLMVTWGVKAAPVIHPAGVGVRSRPWNAVAVFAPRPEQKHGCSSDSCSHAARRTVSAYTNKFWPCDMSCTLEFGGGSSSRWRTLHFLRRGVCSACLFWCRITA